MLFVPAAFIAMMLVGCASGGTGTSTGPKPARAVVFTVHGQTTVFYVSDSDKMIEATDDPAVCAESR